MTLAALLWMSLGLEAALYLQRTRRTRTRKRAETRMMVLVVMRKQGKWKVRVRVRMCLSGSRVQSGWFRGDDIDSRLMQTRRERDTSMYLASCS